MVERCVHKHIRLLPHSSLDADRLVDARELLQLAVADRDLMLAEQGHVAHVVRPHDVPGRGK